MGIVNVTPDSFSDGGRFVDASRAIARGRQLIEEGADLLDIGGESSRPGAEPVSAKEELHRLLPVIDALTGSGVPLSVDTTKTEVMCEAIAAGAALINDISALQAPGALEVIAATDVAVCLMHMQGEPRTMQCEPYYDDVVSEVYGFLAQRVGCLHAMGVQDNRIVVDPGFGFGKLLEHNLALLRRIDSFVGLGVAVLAGVSRKSMLGQITGRAVGERVMASVAAALIAAQKGARILRVHDVAATRDALAILDAVQMTD
jgi:dihydropteroate synthase